MASSKEDNVSNALRQGSSLDAGLQQQAGKDSSMKESHEEFKAAKGIRQTIENEVIPRLVLAHNQLTSRQRTFNSSLPEKHQTAIEKIAEYAMYGNRSAIKEIVNALLETNIGLEELFIDVLAPAAAVFGRDWEDDKVDFVQVSLAIGTLQTLLHELSDEFQHEAASFASDRRVLIISTPGEQHTFGVSMVAEVFRRRGWYVDSSPISNLEELVEHVHKEWFDVAGLSLSAESFLPNLVEGIRQIRRASRNQRIGILVGGPVFNLHPDWLTKVGADALGHDAVQAEQQAHRLIGLLVQGPG
jgi:MerR family transcriptional regulator, light-induced transcriptional regulator